VRSVRGLHTYFFPTTTISLAGALRLRILGPLPFASLCALALALLVEPAVYYLLERGSRHRVVSDPIVLVYLSCKTVFTRREAFACLYSFSRPPPSLLALSLPWPRHFTCCTMRLVTCLYACIIVLNPLLSLLLDQNSTTCFVHTREAVNI
jgi:hypothetical protein